MGQLQRKRGHLWKCNHWLARHWYAVVLVGLWLLPIPPVGANGAYNTWSGLYYCRTEAACIHEQGHRLDDQNGWISESLQYKTALKVYLILEPGSEQAQKIVSLLMEQDHALREVYATIYEIAGGNTDAIPPILQEFYKENIK